MNSQVLFNHAAVSRSEGSTKSVRSSVLALLCVVAFAIVALMALPSGASAFNVANFNYTSSTLQANGHPNTTIAFQRQGTENEDLKDIQLDLPPGVFANPESANPKCSAAQFNSDTCPASAQIGTATVGVKALNLLDLNIAGSIDVLTPDPGQVVTLGISLRPEKICIIFVFCAQPNKIFLKTGITINTFDDSNLRTYTPGQPKSAVIGIPLLFVTPTITGDITVNTLSLAFQGRSGTPPRSCNWLGQCTTGQPTGPYFWRQAGACVPTTSTVTLVSYQNVSSTATRTYTPTGCASVPSTSTAFTFEPQTKKYLTATPVKYKLTIPETDATIQHALPKIVDVDFPLGSGISLNALTGVTSCSETQLRAKACPQSSKIGTALALSKYIPEGLPGEIYATGTVGNQIPIAVLLAGPRQTYVIFRGTLGVRGSVETGDGRAYARFDRIPQLPFSSFEMNVQKSVYVNPDTCGSKTTTSKIEQFSGQNVTRTASYNNTDCPVAPDTTIVQKPADPTVDTTADFTFSSTIPGSTFNCALHLTTEPAPAPVACNSGSYTSEPLVNGRYRFSVFAQNQTVSDPTPATYDFTVNLSSDFEITPSVSPNSVLAGSHPDITAAIDISGGQPASVAIRMPKGFNASLAGRSELCQDPYSGCPAESKIGDATMNVNAGNGYGNVQGVGELFLTVAQTPEDAGSVAVRIQFPFGEFIAIAGAYLVNNGDNQYLDIREFPNKVYRFDPEFEETDITVSRLVFEFDGDTGNLLTAPSSCSNDAFQSSGLSYEGDTAAVETVPYSTTGCGALAFLPTLNQTFSSLQAGQNSNARAEVTIPAGHSTIKNMRVLEPQTFGPNYPAFGESGDMCPGGSADTSSPFDPSGCPEASKVGTMVLDTPLLTEPLVGTVYLINKQPLPWFGVEFNEPGINVRLTGYTDLVKVNPACQETNPDGSLGFCQKQISVSFLDLPDVPISSVDFRLTNPSRQGQNAVLSGNLLRIAQPGDQGCIPNDQARAVIDGHSGATRTLTQPINFTGC